MTPLQGFVRLGGTVFPGRCPAPKVFRPVGAWHLLLHGALKGRHSIAQGNSQPATAALQPVKVRSRYQPDDAVQLYLTQGKGDLSLGKLGRRSPRRPERNPQVGPVQEDEQPCGP
jgi:hypothetical protein